MKHTNELEIEYLPIDLLRHPEVNPRKMSAKQFEDLAASVTTFGTVDPLVINSTPERENIVIGGNQRLEVLKKLGFTTAPVVRVYITDLEKEKELNIRLNKNQGEFDMNLLAKFDENLLKDIGFSSEELDDIFDIDPTPEIFDQVQKQFIVPKKSKWGGKTFTFKELFKCASCRSLVIGEDRYRKRKYSEPRYHIYYHCTRQKKYGCPEPYITEEKLIKQILRYINFMYMATSSDT